MSGEELQEIISRLVARPVALTITDNSHAMITVRWSNPGYRVRLHHMFLEANPAVLKALAGFIGSRSRQAAPVLRQFVATNSGKIKKRTPRPRRAPLRTAGRYFDLREILGQVNREYFAGQVDCGISWGSARRIRSQGSIRLGTYSEQTRTIRVNPRLDRSFVPRYLIEGIVYHEVLHHLLGTTPVRGRKVAHSPAFRRLESRYSHHAQVQAWIKEHRHRLLGR
jgi:predicted SprT family Zn-dependent metalloprotease